MDFLTQLQQALSSIVSLAATAGIAYGVGWLRTKLHITASDSAETTVRTAATTEAGVIASKIPTIVSGAGASPASLVNAGVLSQAVSKVLTDLPAEIKLTGYTPKDIEDMILGSLPAILGAVNPALGAAAGVAAGIIKTASPS